MVTVAVQEFFGVRVRVGCRRRRSEPKKCTDSGPIALTLVSPSVKRVT